MAQEKKAQQKPVKIQYNETMALFAAQFIVNASEHDIIINFSSGPMVDSANGETVLPIHSRIAMGREGAKRLTAILSKVLSQTDPESVPEIAQAQLPKMQRQ